MDKFEELLGNFMDKYKCGARSSAQLVPLDNVAGPSGAAPAMEPLAIMDGHKAEQPPQLPSLPAAAPGPSEAIAGGAKGHAGPTSLKEFEDKAYHKLKGNKTGKLMKRPSAKAPVKASVQDQKKTVKKTTDSKTTKKWKPGSGSFGCIRCRANPKGCDTCKNPLFNGTRFSSRSEWKEYMKAKGK